MTTDVRLTAEVDVLIRDAIELRCANEPDEQKQCQSRAVPSGSGTGGEGVLARSHTWSFIL
jgi:hypothetical protein